VTPKEHAEVWRKAAAVVGSMDRRTQQMAGYVEIDSQSNNFRSMAFNSAVYSSEDAARSDSFATAQRVLLAIAAEYEALAQSPPMKCAECDCTNQPEGCKWIMYANQVERPL